MQLLDALIRILRLLVLSTPIMIRYTQPGRYLRCTKEEVLDDGEPLVTLRPAIVAPPSDYLYSITGTSGSRLPLSPSRYRGGGAKVIDREIYRNVLNWWQGDAPLNPPSGERQR